MADCLVTGGNGFLGSYVVDELVARGHRVRVLDRFSSGVPRFQSKGVSCVVGEFQDDATLREAIDGVTHVFHFLSTTTPVKSEREPVFDLDTNVRRTVELLELASRNGVQHVYFASTGGAIYGTPDVRLVDEEHVTRPSSPYAIGKLAIEGYLRYFSRVTGVATTSFRIANPYGPRQNPTREQGVIPVFLRRAIDGRPLVVYGDGGSVRDYLYVEDAARMIVNASMRATLHDTYNIGSGTGISLMDLINLIGAILPADLQIEYRPASRTAVERIVLDVSRYHSEFEGNRPQVTLEEGLRRTAEQLLPR